ncbi:Ionotropic receptor 206 [Frankliniella occidentalis]|nr:Ionotropic receptor 206 [Frankliniella occidentalis]
MVALVVGMLGVLVQLGLLGLLGAGAASAVGHPVGKYPAEAKCVASFVSSLVPQHKSCLVVHGDVQLVGQLIQELDGERQVVLISPRLLCSQLGFDVRRMTSLFVVAMGSVAQLDKLAEIESIPQMSHILLWIRARSLSDVLPHFATRNMPLWLCFANLYILLSTPNGTSILNSPDMTDRCMTTGRLLRMKEIDRCEPGARGWRRKPWTPVCDGWSQPPRNRSSPVQVFAIRPDYKLGNVNVDEFHHFVGNMTSLLSRRRSVQVLWTSPFSFELQNALRTCRMGAVFLSYSGPVVRNPNTQHISYHFASVVAVVPSGLGQRFGLLRTVTAEFSLALWVTTVLSSLSMTLTVAAAWMCSGRTPTSALAVASLQTLAPLLGQPPQGRTAHRPLSAVWLLMSVVLAAAYQGLLLRELTGPEAEINSLDELEQSNLDVFVEDALFDVVNSRFTSNMKSRTHYFPQEDFITHLHAMAIQRKSAMLYHRDVYFDLVTLPQIAGPPKRLHAFELLDSSHLMTRILFTKGSPLERPLRRALGIFDNGALAKHYFHLAGNAFECLDLTPNSTRELTRPLSLDHLKPAFVMLALGHILSALVFVCEALVYKWSRSQAPPVPVFTL